MSTTMLTRMLMAGGLAVGAMAAEPAVPAQAADRKVVVLHRAGPWRVFYTWALPQVKTADGLKP